MGRFRRRLERLGSSDDCGACGYPSYRKLFSRDSGVRISVKRTTGYRTGYPDPESADLEDHEPEEKDLCGVCGAPHLRIKVKGLQDRGRLR
jgi:hypothetical protein